jgi:hypothetical protein
MNDKPDASLGQAISEFLRGELAKGRLDHVAPNVFDGHPNATKQMLADALLGNEDNETFNPHG